MFCQLFGRAVLSTMRSIPATVLTTLLLSVSQMVWTATAVNRDVLLCRKLKLFAEEGVLMRGAAYRLVTCVELVVHCFSYSLFHL